MIVDLLRNDLGRIAKTGSVKVSKLFEIETHKTLHQMTSQIEADLRENIALYDIFKAIFPCGSITGAPKISTMQIIEQVEKGDRNIYCGAIGLICPEETVFSVPIRILQKKNNEKNFKYRAGGAIVWDSDIQDEWEETITKTKFLNEEFQIIETIKVENGKFLNRLLNGHLEKSVATGICRVQRSLKTAKTPRKVHLRLRFQNLGKPRTAGLCGRAAGACDCGPLSCYIFERGYLPTKHLQNRYQRPLRER